MSLFIKKASSSELLGPEDIKALIPDAGLRRRMSRIVRLAVATATDCLGSDRVDALITATGFGFLADSERFLRNIIESREDLLNPVPFIYSTFNTVGGLVALTEKNQSYNMTFVSRTHGFEDALTDAWMKAEDGEASKILVGAFDEKTDTQYKILDKLGIWKNSDCGEGCVFLTLSSEKEDCLGEILKIDFPDRALTMSECIEIYGEGRDCEVIYSDFSSTGCYPTASARLFVHGLNLISEGRDRVVIYNALWGGQPAVTVIAKI